MNTHLQHANHTTNDWQPRPELRQALREIATITEGDATAVVSDRAITFQNRSERTTISALPINLETVDGLWISERIDIRTPLQAFEDFAEEHLAVVNTFATTGAIVRDPVAGDAVVSSLPVFADDTVALADLYTPLIANAALLHLLGPLSAAFHISGRQDEFGADQVALPGWDYPSFWDASEFEYAQERLSQHGVLATTGPAGLTAEFAWEDGATSAALGQCTSLLQIRADEPHPAAGNGLFFRLDLPVDFREEEANRCAAELNRFEADGVDTPPFFGAWCCHGGASALTFAGFWPNLLYKPGTVANIAFWSWARSRFARQAIGNLR